MQTELERSIEQDTRNMKSPGFDLPALPVRADWDLWARWTWLLQSAGMWGTPHAKAFCAGMQFLSTQPEFHSEAQAALHDFTRARLTRKREWLKTQLEGVNVKDWGLSAAALKEIESVLTGQRPTGIAENERISSETAWVVVETRHGSLACRGARDDLQNIARLSREIDNIEAELNGLCTDAETAARNRAERVKAAKGKPTPAAAPKVEQDFDKQLYQSERKLKRDLQNASAPL